MKKPKHYHERNRIMINYFKMPVGYLIPWDRQHNTTQVSLYGDRKQPPAKNTHEAALSNGVSPQSSGSGLCMRHTEPALQPIGDPDTSLPLPHTKICPSLDFKSLREAGVVLGGW